MLKGDAEQMALAETLTETLPPVQAARAAEQAAMGADVARMGSDRTALVLRHGRVVEHIAVYAKQDLMVTVGRIMAAVSAWQVDEIDVDMIGVGTGVYDRLVELRRQELHRCLVYGVNVAEAAPEKHHDDAMACRRLRDYLWLQAKQWLEQEQPVFGADPVLSSDLAAELASVQYTLDSNGHLEVEQKERMKARLGHSPDLADALCCTLAPPPPALKRAQTWAL